jgi:hypothetical protein
LKNSGVNDNEIRSEKKRLKKDMKKHRKEAGDDSDDRDYRTNW